MPKIWNHDSLASLGKKRGKGSLRCWIFQVIIIILFIAGHPSHHLYRKSSESSSLSSWSQCHYQQSFVAWCDHIVSVTVSPWPPAGAPPEEYRDLNLSRVTQLVTSHLSKSQLLRIKDVSAVTRWPRAPFPAYLAVNFWKSVYSRPRRVLEKSQQTSPTDFPRESAVEPQGDENNKAHDVPCCRRMCLVVQGTGCTLLFKAHDVPCSSQRDVLCSSHTFHDLKSSMPVEVPPAQNPPGSTADFSVFN